MSGASRKSLERAVERACTTQQKHLAFEDLGSFLTERGEYREALECYEETLKEAEKLGDELKIAKAHRMIGQVQTELSQCEGAITHLLKYLELTTSSGDSFLVEQQRAYTSLGRCYLIIAENILEDDESCKAPLELSTKYTSRSLKLCEKLEKVSVSSKEVNHMRAISLLNLGLAEELKQNIDGGIEAINVAVLISKSLEEVSLTCKCLGSLVPLFVKKNMPSKVLELSKEGLQWAKKVPGSGRVSTTCSFLISQGDAYLLSLHFRQARRKFYEAYKMKNPDDEMHAVAEKKLKIAVLMQKTQEELRSLPEENYAERAKCFELLGDASSSLRFYKMGLLYYEDQLKCLVDDDRDKLRECYASLGQTAMDCGFFEKAIMYFEKEIELSKASEVTIIVQRSAKVLFVASEQMYSASSVERNLEILKAMSSYLSVGHCQKRARMPPEQYAKSYQAAYDNAVECGHKRMQKNALKILEETQRLIDTDRADETLNLLEQLEEEGFSSQSSDDSDKNTQDLLGDDIDVDNLSDCDGSSDEDVQGRRLIERRSPLEEKTVRPKRKPRRQVSEWRNSVGETKLHLACMCGNLKTAKIFVGEGCDIEAMDHAGWTPLHEACNHGHLDLVRFLLDNGADINNRGGKGIRGLTPLHDAASAGNFDVMNLLLDYNASVTQKTDDGETVLDMLEEFHQRTMEKEGFSEMEAQNYLHVKDRIIALMKTAGIEIKAQNKASQPSPRIPTVTRNRDHNKNVGNSRTNADCLDESYKRRRTMRDLSPIRRSPSPSSRSSSMLSDEEPSEKSPLAEDSSWAREYRNVMKGLRHKNTANTVVRAACQPVLPLLNENEIMRGDWLDDDLGLNTKPQKKRKTSSEKDIEEFIGQRNKRCGQGTRRKSSQQKLSLSSYDKSPTLNESGRRSFEKDKSSRCSAAMDLDFNDENQDLNASVMHIENFDMRNRSPSPRRSTGNKPPKLSVPRVRQASLQSLGFDRSSPPRFSSTQISTLAPSTFSQIISAPQLTQAQPPMHRINVKIENQLLAVPVGSLEFSIGWLAEEASNRYYKMEGLKPTLRLKTQDGALLCHEDPVSLLIGGGDVLGDVTSFNLPPIATRYQEACDAHNVEPDIKIVQDLEASQATHQLRIVNACLTTAVLKPVIRALAMEHLLQHLDLSQNSLKDEGVLELCEHSLRLVHLQELNLSGNMITSQGIFHLSEAVKSGKFKSLVDINLNYNDLGNGSVSNLAKLTGWLPNLESLHLAGCDFTRSLWEHCNNYLNLSNIQVLDLSCNALHAHGLAGFLGNNQPNSFERLNPDHVRTLLLSGVEGSHLCSELQQFFERSQNPALVELHLTAPGMTDEDLTNLLGGLQNATKFTSLRLLSASSLTARGLHSLFTRHPPVRKLEIQGGENLIYEVHDIDLENDLYQAIKSAARAMELLAIKSPHTKAENNLSTQLETAWREVWRNNCDVKRSSRDVLRLTKRCY